MNNDTRTDYTAGLRALADLLDAHEELPLPYMGTGTEIAFHYLSGADPRADLAAFARIMPGPFKKTPFDNYFQLSGSIHGLRVSATAYREKVCTRVVTGTREITEDVPDADALAAVPTTTVTRTVEDIEWVCEPLLSDRVAS